MVLDYPFITKLDVIPCFYTNEYSSIVNRPTPFGYDPADDFAKEITAAYDEGYRDFIIHVQAGNYPLKLARINFINFTDLIQNILTDELIERMTYVMRVHFHQETDLDVFQRMQRLETIFGIIDELTWQQYMEND